MKINFTIALFAVFIGVLCAQHRVEYRQQLLLMGCSFEFTVIDEDTSLCRAALDTAIAEVLGIESLVSSWKSTSETSRINAHAGKGSIAIHPELYALIQRAQKVSKLSQDAFSLCFGSVYHLYNFNKTILELPHRDTLAFYRTLTSSNNIVLEGNSTLALNKDCKIGFGAIAKGYAADRVKLKLQAMGIEHACINASGDLTVWGNNKEGKAWSIGISDPKDPEKLLLQLSLENTAIVTSGDYENYFLTPDGTRYSHIIDPRTCIPVRNRLSVSVISPSTEFSDALATAICVLGVEEGLALVNRLKDVEALIIDQNHEIYYSDHIDHH